LFGVIWMGGVVQIFGHLRLSEGTISLRMVQVIGWIIILAIIINYQLHLRLSEGTLYLSIRSSFLGDFCYNGTWGWVRVLFIWFDWWDLWFPAVTGCASRLLQFNQSDEFEVLKNHKSKIWKNLQVQKTSKKWFNYKQTSYSTKFNCKHLCWANQ